MVLECSVLTESSDGSQMYCKVFIGGFPSFCKLLSVSHHLQYHLGLVLGLQVHCCDIFSHVLNAF